MTQEEIKRICQIYDDIRRERDAATIGYNSEDAFWEHVTVMCNLSKPSLPSNLNEAAEEWAKKKYGENYMDFPDEYRDKAINALLNFKAGAKWKAEQGWIDDGSMPPEYKDICTGHMVSERVLAWDSMYDARVDFTIDGKWASETRGGYTGQICHGIVAWMPIPQYKEKQ